MVTVNKKKLEYCLTMWRAVGCKGCEYCPAFPCNQAEEKDIERCVKYIMRWLTDVDEVVKPQ